MALSCVVGIGGMELFVMKSGSDSESESSKGLFLFPTRTASLPSFSSPPSTILLFKKSQSSGIDIAAIMASRSSSSSDIGRLEQRGLGGDRR